MVLRVALLLAALAGPAGAACLPEGRTPKRVMFEDGQVVDGIRRQGDRLRYQSSMQPGMTTRVETLWALYPVRSVAGDNSTVFDWGNARLPAPRDLVRGQKVTLTGTMTLTGAAPADYRMTVRLIGAETVTVAGCAYGTLRIAVTMGAPGMGRFEGERWLDPDRLVVWRSVTRAYGSDGRLAQTVDTRAFAAD